jgi:hypothetical protein
MAAIRPTPIETLEAYKSISPDSGFPTFIHPLYNPKIKAYVTPDPPHKAFTPPKDRGYFADLEKKALFAVTKQVDLTESIGILPRIYIIDTMITI